MSWKKDQKRKWKYVAYCFTCDTLLTREDVDKNNHICVNDFGQPIHKFEWCPCENCLFNMWHAGELPVSLYHLGLMRDIARETEIKCLRGER